MLPYIFLSPLLSNIELISCIIEVLRKLSIEIWYHKKMRHRGTNEGYSPENTVVVSYCAYIITD